MEGGAFTGLAFHPNFSPVGQHNVFGQHQPQAGIFHIAVDLIVPRKNSLNSFWISVAGIPIPVSATLKAAKPLSCAGTTVMVILPLTG